MMDQKQKQVIVSAYEKRFNSAPPYIVSAPGRINLVGEHTDYSEGWVLPVAIDRNMSITFSPTNDGFVHIYSIDYNGYSEFDLENLEHNQSGWIDYIKGVAWALIDSGHKISGWQGVVAGNIPIGAGLSSSAALEVAIAKTFCLASNINMTPTELALISQKAETDWVGVNVGIMDPLISAAGKQNHALLLDCRTLAFTYVPIPETVSFVVLDTSTRRELTHSAYNTRHDEVEKASKLLEVAYLRDASPALLQEKRSKLDSTLFRRANHIIKENERVHEFSTAMRNADLFSMGQLINESHTSLRDEFEVSSRELDLIVELAQNHVDCLGARMMGAGFGGCALALLRNDHSESFSEEIYTAFHAETGLRPHIFKVLSVNGVSGYLLSDDDR